MTGNDIFWKFLNCEKSITSQSHYSWFQLRIQTDLTEIAVSAPQKAISISSSFFFLASFILWSCGDIVGSHYSILKLIHRHGTHSHSRKRRAAVWCRHSSPKHLFTQESDSVPHRRKKKWISAANWNWASISLWTQPLRSLGPFFSKHFFLFFLDGG